MDLAQHFSSLPLEELRKGLGIAATSPPAPSTLIAAATLEVLMKVILEDTIQEHEALSSSSSVGRRMKEGRLACQQVQLALRRKRLASLFAADAPPSTNNVVLGLQRVAEGFLDTSTVHMLKPTAEEAPGAADGDSEEKVATDGEAEASEKDGPGATSDKDGSGTARDAEKEGPGTARDPMKEVETWQRRRDDLVTEKEITSILKLVNPAFSFSNDALVFLLAINRELIVEMKQLNATPPNTGEEVSAFYNWLPESLWSRIRETSDVLLAAAEGKPLNSFLPPTITLKVKILRGNGSVASSHSASVPRSDTLNEYLNVACRAMYVERKDYVFLHGWVVIESTTTPEDLNLPGNATIFGVTGAWWDNARREEGRRGILTAGGRAADSSLKSLKARAVSRVAEDIKSSSASTTAPASPVAPPVDKQPTAADVAPKKPSGSAALARINRLQKENPAALESRDAERHKAVEPAYRPVPSGHATKLPVLSPSKVASLLHGAPAPPDLNASSSIRTRLIKTPAVGFRTDTSRVDRLAPAASKPDYGKRFVATAKPITSGGRDKSAVDPKDGGAKATTRVSRRPTSDAARAPKTSPTTRSRSHSINKASPGKPSRSPARSRRASFQDKGAVDDATLFTDLQRKALEKSEKKEAAEKSKPTRKLQTNIGMVQLPARAAMSLLQKSEETVKPLNAAVRSLSHLAAHLSGTQPPDGKEDSTDTGPSAEVDLRKVRDVLTSAQESTKAMLTMVMEIEKQSKKKEDANRASSQIKGRVTISDGPGKQSTTKLETSSLVSSTHEADAFSAPAASPSGPTAVNDVSHAVEAAGATVAGGVHMQSVPVAGTACHAEPPQQTLPAPTLTAGVIQDHSADPHAHASHETSKAQITSEPEVHPSEGKADGDRNERPIDKSARPEGKQDDAATHMEKAATPRVVEPPPIVPEPSLPVSQPNTADLDSAPVESKSEPNENDEYKADFDF